MKEPHVAPVREYDEQGRLVSAGVVWNEYDMIAHRWCLSVAALGLLFAVPALLFLLASLMFPKQSGYELLASAIVLGFGIVSAVAFAIFLDRKWKKRALIFRRDGLMHTPYGYLVGKTSESVAGHHDIIRSIERGPADFFDAIVIYSHEGTQVSVGYRVCPTISLIVTVQLNKALQEIRKASAAPAQNATPRAGRRKVD
jgi:hypothetical protein